MDGSCPACHAIVAPASYTWNLYSTWNMAYSKLWYGVSWAWDGPVRTRLGYSQQTLAKNSTSKLVVGSVVSSSRGVITYRPICGGVCHDFCLCNLPSFLDLYAKEYLQHIALLDHTHKNLSFPWIVTVSSWRCHFWFQRQCHYHNGWALLDWYFLVHTS